MSRKSVNNTSFGKWFAKNLLLAAVVVVAVISIAAVSLHFITRHGQEIKVPDFSNMSFAEAGQLAALNGVRVYEGDSIYIKQMRPGAVYSQNPEAGSTVKKGRRIMLTMNTRKAKQVVMPSLVGFSLPQAKGELQNKGLSLGRLRYVTDIATNNVLGQTYNGVNIKPGTKIKAGSTIDLVVGLNPTDNRTIAPKLEGMTYLQAVNAIHDAFLNVGRVKFDRNIRNCSDSLKAVVYEQNPKPDAGICALGTDVSLKLKRKSE